MEAQLNISIKERQEASFHRVRLDQIKRESSLQIIRFPENFDLLPKSEFEIQFSVLLIKRLLDMTGAILGLILFSPLMVLVAFAIKLTSSGPIFFCQQRVGYNGNEFKLIKFRSMRVDAERETGPTWADEGKGRIDPRVTPIGNFLRKSHLDELPQLLLVLLGHMSIVGPRPERPEFVAQLEINHLYYSERYSHIKPGVTGIAQMRREVDEALQNTDEKLLADHTYSILLSNTNFWTYLLLDLQVVFGTIFNIIFRNKQINFLIQPNRSQNDRLRFSKIF